MPNDFYLPIREENIYLVVPFHPVKYFVIPIPQNKKGDRKCNLKPYRRKGTL